MWIAVCLFTGVVLNGAVAWGLVWVTPIPFGSTLNTVKVTTAPMAELALPVELPRPDKFFGWVGFAESYWQMLWDEPALDGKDAWPPKRSIVIHLTRSGWPMRSMQHQASMQVMYQKSAIVVNQISPTNFASWRGGLDWGSKRYGTFPVWPGFLINTLFFAAIVGLCLWGAVSLRMRWRRREGVCEACGYDRRGLAVGAACPECGCGPVPVAERPPGTGGPPEAR